MSPLARDFVKFVFKKDYKGFSPESIRYLSKWLEGVRIQGYHLTHMNSAKWFELDDEYIVENKIPIEVDAIFISPEVTNKQGSIYVYFDFEEGDLSEETEFDPTELGDPQ